MADDQTNDSLNLPRIMPPNNSGSSSILAWASIIISIIALLIGGYVWHTNKAGPAAITAIQNQLSSLGSQINDKTQNAKQTAPEASENPAFNQLKQTIQTQQTALSQQNTVINALGSRVKKIQQQLEQTNQQLGQTKQGLKNPLKLNSENNQRWTLGEASYLLKLAELNLAVGKDIDGSLYLLEQASLRLNKLTMPALTATKDQLEQDIGQLQKLPKTDITELSKKINGVSDQVEQLPINPSKNLKFKPQQTNNTDDKEKTKLDLKDWHSIKASVSGLKNLFVIRRLDQPVTPLPSPSELVFVKENVRLKLSQAQWAVLYQNESLYHLNMKEAIDLLTKHFENNAGTTNKIISQLETLQAITIKVVPPTLKNSISEIEKVTAQLEQQSTASLNALPEFNNPIELTPPPKQETQTQQDSQTRKQTNTENKKQPKTTTSNTNENSTQALPTPQAQQNTSPSSTNNQSQQSQSLNKPEKNNTEPQKKPTIKNEKNQTNTLPEKPKTNNNQQKAAPGNRTNKPSRYNPNASIPI